MKDIALKLMLNYFVKLIDDDELLVKASSDIFLTLIPDGIEVHAEPMSIDTYLLTFK